MQRAVVAAPDFRPLIRVVYMICNGETRGTRTAGVVNWNRGRRPPHACMGQKPDGMKTGAAYVRDDTSAVTLTWLVERARRSNQRAIPSCT